MVMSFSAQVTLSTSSLDTSVELQKLLEKYVDIFQTLTSLPPPMLQDHKIPFKDVGSMIKIKPYRYPTVQNTEMEKLIQEML